MFNFKTYVVRCKATTYEEEKRLIDGEYTTAYRVIDTEEPIHAVSFAENSIDVVLMMGASGIINDIVQRECNWGAVIEKVGCTEIFTKHLTFKMVAGKKMTIFEHFEVEEYKRRD